MIIRSRVVKGPLVRFPTEEQVYTVVYVTLFSMFISKARHQIPYILSGRVRHISQVYRHSGDIKCGTKRSGIPPL